MSFLPTDKDEIHAVWQTLQQAKDWEALKKVATVFARIAIAPSWIAEDGDVNSLSPEQLIQAMDEQFLSDRWKEMVPKGKSLGIKYDKRVFGKVTAHGLTNVLLAWVRGEELMIESTDDLLEGKMPADPDTGDTDAGSLLASLFEFALGEALMQPDTQSLLPCLFSNVIQLDTHGRVLPGPNFPAPKSWFLEERDQHTQIVEDNKTQEEAPAP